MTIEYTDKTENLYHAPPKSPGTTVEEEIERLREAKVRAG